MLRTRTGSLCSRLFNHLDVYDELVLFYLLFTINKTTSIVRSNPINAMNDFMKNYCFFQLAQLGRPED